MNTGCGTCSESGAKLHKSSSLFFFFFQERARYSYVDPFIQRIRRHISEADMLSSKTIPQNFWQLAYLARQRTFCASATFAFSLLRFSGVGLRLNTFKAIDDEVWWVESLGTSKAWAEKIFEDLYNF